MNQGNLFNEPAPIGEKVMGWCKCGAEVECVLRTFSNGTKHAWGTCQKCGLTNAKQQRRAIGLEDLTHTLMGLRQKILAMPKGVNQDEAICMLERQVEELWREVS
jgi:hypothetical protein